MSKKSITLSIVLALAFFLFLVIRQIPANFALAHAANQTGVFTPFQVRGTLWQGQAGNIIIQQRQFRLELGQVKWQLSGWSLLSGDLCLQIDANNGAQKIAGDFCLALSDMSLQADNVELALDGQLFKSFLPMPVKYQAFIELTLQTLGVSGLESNKPNFSALSGNLVVKDLGVNFGQSVTLGSYGARLSLSDKQVDDESIVQVNLSDIDASVAISGDIQLLASTQSYYVDVALTPKADAKPIIKNSLSQFYKAQADGSFQVKLGQPL